MPNNIIMPDNQYKNFYYIKNILDTIARTKLLYTITYSSITAFLQVTAIASISIKIGYPYLGSGATATTFFINI